MTSPSHASLTQKEFTDGTYDPFFPPDGASVSLVDCTGSDCALKTDKDHWFQGPIVEVPVDCLGEVGSKWRLQFDSYMLNESGAARWIAACGAGTMFCVLGWWRLSVSPTFGPAGRGRRGP